MSQINVTRSSMPTYEEYCEEIKELWESRWLTHNGVKHKELEAKLKVYMDTPNITLYTNGHLALENALNVLDLTGEVITTPYTFASTTQAIVRNRLMPVFCDVKEDDYTIDPDKIEALITEKTSAIVGVHVYGNLCEVEKIQKIADKYNLKVIYDAAHAFGASKNGVNASCFGDISMFSFHATKVFHTIEGGCLTYKDEKYKDKLNALKFYGMYENGEYSEVGSNAKMTEFAAAMGLCNLRHIDGEIAKRGAAAERYYERLSDVKGIKLNVKQPGVKPNYAYFPVVFDGYKETRDELFDKLEVLESHRWMTLGQVKSLMRYDNLVNMDTRTVISCLPFYELSGYEDEELSFLENKPLLSSVTASYDSEQMREIYNFFNNYKMLKDVRPTVCPLHTLSGWDMCEEGIFCKTPYPFKVVYCDIEIEGREVKRWTQPLFEAIGIACFGLLMYEDNGKLMFVVKAKPEIGCFDGIELGPTYQKEAVEKNGAEQDIITDFFESCLCNAKGIKFDRLLSEEGGRFYHEQNRNVLIEADKKDIPDLPGGYFALDFATLNRLVQTNNVLNIQLRNLCYRPDKDSQRPRLVARNNVCRGN